MCFVNGLSSLFNYEEKISAKFCTYCQGFGYSTPFWSIEIAQLAKNNNAKIGFLEKEKHRLLSYAL